MPIMRENKKLNISAKIISILAKKSRPGVQNIRRNRPEKIKPGYQTFSKIEGLAMGYPQQNIFLAVYG